MSFSRRHLLLRAAAGVAALVTSNPTSKIVENQNDDSTALPQSCLHALDALKANIEQDKPLDRNVAQQLLEQITDKRKQESGIKDPGPDQYYCSISPALYDSNISIAIVIDPWRQTIAAFKEKTSGEHLSAPTRAGIYNQGKIDSDDTVYNDAALFAVNQSVGDEYTRRLEELNARYIIQHPDGSRPNDEERAAPSKLILAGARRETPEIGRG